MPQISRRTALLLFAIVVTTWGMNWVVTKTILNSVTPLWTTAIRSIIATVVLLAVLLVRGQFVVPRRGDIPVILATGLLHMVAFSVLVAFGLGYVPVGRSVVLGYTTPLWVAPGAWLLLGESMSRTRIWGVVIGLAGVAVIFNPVTFNWQDTNAVLGNGMILLAALCWAVCIIYVRAHKWISSPFQMVFWQALLASGVLGALALWHDGVPHIDWNPTLVSGFLYGAILGTALAYWAMSIVNASLPAITTSLGILATPVVGLAASAIVLGEPIDLPLIIAMAMILGGIAIGTIPQSRVSVAASR